MNTGRSGAGLLFLRGGGVKSGGVSFFLRGGGMKSGGVSLPVSGGGGGRKVGGGRNLIGLSPGSGASFALKSTIGWFR